MTICTFPTEGVKLNIRLSVACGCWKFRGRRLHFTCSLVGFVRVLRAKGCEYVHTKRRAYATMSHRHSVEDRVLHRERSA